MINLKKGFRFIVPNFSEKLSRMVMLLIYKFTLELAYYFAISPLYKYAHLEWNPDRNSFLISVLMTCVIAYTLPEMKDRASTIWCIVFNCMSVFPMISLYWMQSRSLLPVLSVTIMMLIIHTILNISGSSRGISFKWLNRYNTKKLILALFVIYVTAVVFLVIRRGGIDARTFNFLENKDIYLVRSGNNLGTISSYIFSWSEKILFFFFFSIALYKKKVLMAFTAVVCEVLLFSSYGNKIALLGVIFVFGIYFLLTMNRKRNGNLIIAFFSLVMLAMAFFYNIEYTKSIGRKLTGIYGMRALFIPAFIKFQYFDFFETRPYLYFADGIIGKIFGITSPYGGPISLVIGQHVGGEGSGSWNTGLVADAYANLGLFGIFAFAILTGIVLRLFDKVTSNYPLPIKGALICMYAVLLNDNALLTTLLTNGLVLMLLVAGLYNSVSNKDTKRRWINLKI